MVTVGEFRRAIEEMIDYIGVHEEDDFRRQLEDENYEGAANHIFLSAYRAFCALQEADGGEYYTLAEWLDGKSLKNTTQYFLCTNLECQYLGTQADPLMDSQIFQLETNEPVPAGGCPHCGGIVRSI